MNEFNKNKYVIIKNVINKDLCNFLHNYLLVKRQVAETLIKETYISPFEEAFGTWEDDQVPNTYSHYADIAMETLLLKLQPIMEKQTGMKLNPSYSFLRIYKKGDVLERHKDRFSCEISTTLNLGGDNWPIYINPNPDAGFVYGENFGKHSIQNYFPTNDKGVEINLNPGDMLIYRGCDLEHWREKFEGDECCQVFLHYNNTETKDSELHLFDKRPHLGLPGWFKGRK